jgi:hypothetical protein
MKQYLFLKNTFKGKINVILNQLNYRQKIKANAFIHIKIAIY